MDQSDDHIQSLGICHKLFCFIVKTLTAHATKPVTLGDPSHSKLCITNAQKSGPMPQTAASEYPDMHPESDGESIILIEEVDFDAVKPSNGSCDMEQKARELAPRVSVQKRPARKMVSIKDEAEVIDLGKKRRRLSFEKQMSSMKNRDNAELRPLKSILRVGSIQK